MKAALLVLSAEIRGRSPNFVSAWKNSTVDRLLHFSTLLCPNSFFKKKSETITVRNNKPVHTNIRC